MGGQAVAVRQVMEGDYADVRLVLVRMGFSREMDEIGRLTVRKLLMVPSLVARIAWARVRTGADVLYYPPSSLERIGLYRDIAVLLATRWMFRRTLYHFLSGGISEHYPRLSPPVRWLVRRALFRPDLAIRVSEFAPPDPAAVEARREVLLANAVEPVPDRLAAAPPVRAEPPVALFAAVLRPSKGILDLLDAAAEAHRHGARFRLRVLGRYPSAEVEAEIAGRVERLGLAGVVEFAGLVTGEALHEEYGRASVFCFPSYFESEAEPLVVAHALQHGLPVVATRWRGIPAMVVEGESGYLVEPRDVEGLAARLSELLADGDLRARMGRRGRQLYESRYTLRAFHAGMQQVFDSLRV